MIKRSTFLIFIFCLSTAFSVNAMDFCCRNRPGDTFDETGGKSVLHISGPRTTYMSEEEVAIKFMKEVISLHQDGVIGGLTGKDFALNEQTSVMMLANLKKQAIKQTDLKSSVRRAEKKHAGDISFLTMPMIRESSIFGDLEELNGEVRRGTE